MTRAPTDDREIGTSIQNVVSPPARRSDSTPMRPPCCSMIACAIASPRPVPPRVGAVELLKAPE
jgi:hypothetical protein